MNKLTCINDKFSREQLSIFGRYNIQTPIFGETYSLRASLNTRMGKAYLLNEIVNPRIPEGYIDPEGSTYFFEPSWGTFRFATEEVNQKQEVEQLELQET